MIQWCLLSELIFIRKYFLLDWKFIPRSFWSAYPSKLSLIFFFLIGFTPQNSLTFIKAFQI